MFTGIIKEIGKVSKITGTKKAKTFTVQAKSILKDKKAGQSIAANGVCVTITEIRRIKAKAGYFSFNAIDETLNRSNLGQLKTGDSINLEPSLKFNQSLDGHLVLGHVDAQGTIIHIEGFIVGTKDHSITISFPTHLKPYIVFKGSIAINGVSLTITEVKNSRSGNSFTAKLIPHTLKMTNLKDLKIGDKVNLEVDLIARYLKNLAAT